MNSQPETLRADWKTLVASVRLLNELDGAYLLVVIGHALMETAQYFLALIMTARILDELLGGGDVAALILYVSIAVGGSFLLKLGSDWLERMRRAKGRTLAIRVDKRISAKILALDYAYMDSPLLHDLRQRILEYDNMNGSITAFASQMGDLITSLTQIVASVFVAAALFAPVKTTGQTGLAAAMSSPLWSVVLLAAMAGAIWVQMYASRRYGEFQMELFNGAMGINRIGLYMMFTLCGDYRNGKDLRIYDSESMVAGVHRKFVSDMEQYLKKMAKTKVRVESLGSVSNGVFVFLIYAFVALKALAGMITVGSVMQYIGAIRKLFGGISGLFVGITEIRVSCRFLNDIHTLLNLPDIMYRGTLPVEKRSDHEYEVEFCNVSFRYPGAAEFALEHVSMKLNIGERLAVVGMNGAGKTTFIKLLCRLYDPTEGEIRLNGIDIRKYDYKEYLSLFSVVFQDFRILAFPVDMNVASSATPDEANVWRCAEKAGLADRLKTLPGGTSTSVGRLFDEAGVDFSGGETQKMAIARALYKDAPVIVLDEPTASLDPLSEFEIYSRFDTLVGGKTAVYISHRLSSCRFCSDIIVFKDGQIVQRGGHEQLLRQTGGLYRELWSAQAQYYCETAGASGSAAAPDAPQ
ncbi:MAG TPA: ABC transporter ATP-binding protein [Eubacteriales bacterium]|nr:ABC transporter ATP-binding protein [Eubacteriales bacterium]